MPWDVIPWLPRRFWSSRFWQLPSQKRSCSMRYFSLSKKEPDSEPKRPAFAHHERRFMNALILLPEAGTGQIQQIANTFGVDQPHLAAQIISFSIVCVLLHRFAYKPVLQLLEE